MRNLALYSQLMHKFGNVKVSNEGEPPTYTTVGGKIQFTSWGECYRICCPACRPQDTKYHLYIPHFYGAKAGVIEMPKMLKCFRECNITPSDFEAYLKFGVASHAIDLASCDNNREIRLGVELTYVPITGRKDSAAYKYMEARGFSDDRLLLYDVGVATSLSNPDYHFAEGWVVFPIRGQDRLYGYQLRQPTFDDVDLRYLTLPGTKCSWHLFGYSQAVDSNFSFVILVEGPTDVLRIGPPAVCMFSSSLSTLQLQLLFSRWSNGTVLYTIDMDDSNFEYKQQKLREKLSGQFENVIPLMLDQGRDPASYSQTEIWDKIIFALSSVNIPLDIRELQCQM